MRPTIRCVLVLAAGIPIALTPAFGGAELWTIWPTYLALVMGLCGLDAILGLRRGLLDINVHAPDTLFIGAQGSLVVGWARPPRMEASASRRSAI